MHLSDILRDCLVLVEHEMAKKEIHLESDLAEVGPVRIDPGEMQQVVINLVMNAVQAMETGGTLTLVLGEADRDGVPHAILRVRDNGPGIAADKIGAVFDPFFTTRLGEGTGLGLSISQTLVQQAGGLITARNHPAGGAEFTVWLPLDHSASMAAQ